VKLEEIDLAGNLLTNVDKNLLTNLKRLDRIFLSKNPLTVVDFAMFQNNTILFMLFLDDIGSSKILNIEMVDRLENIQILSLLRNQCIDDQYHEGNLLELKRDVKAKCE
jgi:Leucine-rich repeat (LRR) protein